MDAARETRESRDRAEAMRRQNNGARRGAACERSRFCCLWRSSRALYTTKSSGLGMGLSISRSIVEAHGGRLWAEDNSDTGTVFRFTVPQQGAA